MSEATDCAPRDALRLRLRASPASASVLRAEIRRWLSELRISREDVLDLQLACSEALMLVIEGSAAPVALVLDVEGRLDGSTATISIRDYGLCREVRPEQELETFSLALIQAMVDDFELRAHEAGMTVVLTRNVRSY